MYNTNICVHEHEKPFLFRQKKRFMWTEEIYVYRENVYLYIRRHACTRGDLAVNICHLRVLCTPRAYSGHSTPRMRPGRASIWPVPDVKLHYTILYRIKLHYTTLHYTTRHYTTLHYTTLHYISPPGGAPSGQPYYTTLHQTIRHLYYTIYLLQGGAPSGRSNGTDVRGRGKRPSGWDAANAAPDRSDAPPVATTARPATAALSYPTPRPSLNPCPSPDRS